MKLTAADRARPAVRRLNAAINTLTAIVWFPLAVLRKVLFFIFWWADWVFNYTFDHAVHLRDYLISRYLDWRPTK